MKKVKPHYKRKIYKRKKGSFGKPKYMLQGGSKYPTPSFKDMTTLADMLGALFGRDKAHRPQER